ncbi:MAG: hypothetical protein ACI8XB_000706 [Patiriisocius sp.]|jgi:hypothetical protein
MKKLFTLAIAALFTLSISFVSAQSNRMAFVEEATQASCPPCATLNPALQSLMNANSETAIFMAYQVWWPGFDQMYLDNPSEVDTRVGDYYGYQFAPQGILQGDFIGAEGAVDDLTQSGLDAVSSQMSEFDMEVSAEVVDGQLLVTGNVTATMAATGDLVLRIALTEGTIYSTQATGGTNGETEFHHVFKAFVGGTSGVDLEDTWADGDSYTINETLDMTELTIYNYDDLEVIALVQNDANKFVHQATKDSDVPVSSNFENSAAGVSIDGLPASVCIGDAIAAPVFTLANFGNVDLTSATITYSINGGADQTMTWEGTLSTLATEDVVLDDYAYTAMASNTVDVAISMPNGVADEDGSANDAVSSEFAGLNAGASVTLELLTDNYGAETSWEILNGAGVAVLGGSGYGNNTEYTETYTVPLGDNDCYEFKIYDSFGDGICCGWGIGNYSLLDGAGNVLVEGGEFADETAENFSVDGVTGIEELNITNFSIYPNPTNDVTNIAFESFDNKDYVVEVLDIAGRVVYSEALGTLNAGSQLIQVDAKQFEDGMYLFNIYSGSDVATKRVSIIK